MYGALRAHEWDYALRLARITNLIFRSDICARLLPTTSLYVECLFRAGLHYKIVGEFSSKEPLNDAGLNAFIGAAHIFEGDPSLALFYLDRAIELDDSHPYFRLKGRAHLLLGQEDAARDCFSRSVLLAPHTVMAHMNYAGRYDNGNYLPKAWELRDSGDLLLFDNYGQLAEELMHLGYLSRGLALYQKMLRKQQRYSYRQLPDALLKRLARLDPRFDPAKPVRLLGYEWVIQFGHTGYLDLYKKMSILGMYAEGNHVLLAPKEKIANEHLLSYWEPHYTVVRDPELVAELFPWQRILADGFNAYPGEGDVAEHWTRAASRAQIEWARQKRKPLLTLSLADRTAGIELLAKLGVPDSAWYVGLHVREGTFYRETKGHMSLHRNADIEDYYPAIKAITDRGGYVIRLGDPSMRPLPEMPGVIDYARSPHKSAAADIFFCATSRFIIGTTSGLTNASLCFGTPMLIVNSISSDWQLWSADTDFILKRVRSVSERRFLSLRETYTDPTQGYLMNLRVMRRHGLETIPNNADDILKAVTYKLDMLSGIERTAQEDELLDSYRNAIAGNSPIFGAARPVPAFLADHPELLN
jgi:putative glycosyltransferase (TIGR04372 family)